MKTKKYFSHGYPPPPPYKLSVSGEGTGGEGGECEGVKKKTKGI
jgi:hypothetical protein